MPLPALPPGSVLTWEVAGSGQIGRTAGNGGKMLELAILGAVAYWLVWEYCHPFRPCPRCASRAGKNAGSTSRRWGKCKRCGGSRELQAPVSRALHRMVSAMHKGRK
jgi:hypothetical protein